MVWGQLLIYLFYDLLRFVRYVTDGLYNQAWWQIYGSIFFVIIGTVNDLFVVRCQSITYYISFTNAWRQSASSNAAVLKWRLICVHLFRSNLIHFRNCLKNAWEHLQSVHISYHALCYLSLLFPYRVLVSFKIQNTAICSVITNCGPFY